MEAVAVENLLIQASKFMKRCRAIGVSDSRRYHIDGYFNVFADDEKDVIRLSS